MPVPAAALQSRLVQTTSQFFVGKTSSQCLHSVLMFGRHMVHVAAIEQTYGDPARSALLTAAAHSIEMLPATAQKRRSYVAAENGKVIAQQCLESAHLTVEFTSAAAALGLLQRHYGLPPGRDETMPGTYCFDHDMMQFKFQQAETDLAPAALRFEALNFVSAQRGSPGRSKEQVVEVSVRSGPAHHVSARAGKGGAPLCPG